MTVNRESKKESDAFRRGFIKGMETQKRFVSDLQKRRNFLIEENEAMKDRLFYLESYFNTSHKEK